MAINRTESDPLQRANFNQYDWEKVVADSPKKWNIGYAPLFAEAERLKESGDNRGYEVFAFLGRIASLNPDYEQRGNPYDLPWRKTDDQPIISKSELDILASLLVDIKDAEFRARVADLLWEFRKDHKAAEVAISAFMESGKKLEDPLEWPRFTKPIERAFELAAKLGRNKPLHQEIAAEIEKLIAKFATVPESGLLCLRFMEMLMQHRLGDALKYAEISERLAKLFSERKQWDFANFYWDITAKWQEKAGNESDASQSRINGAECWISKAEENLSDGKLGPGFSAHWFGSALAQLRQAGAKRERIAEIHLRFRALQKETMKEMSPLELDEKVVAEAEKSCQRAAELARQHIQGRPFDEALFRLAFIRPPVDPEKIKRGVESQSKNSVWLNLIGTASVTETGATAESFGPMPTNAGPERDEWLKQNVLLRARTLDWPQEVACVIGRARDQFASDHPLSITTIAPLVQNNPFILPGREGIYARGLLAGFNGDGLVAVHLLIPQLEASIRKVFEDHGIVTSNLESDSTQEEKNLGWLLYQPQMDSIFGKERSFNLRGLLVEKFGMNFRHDMAHGLISEAAFYSPAAEYLWWLILQLCCLGHHLSAAGTK